MSGGLQGTEAEGYSPTGGADAISGVSYGYDHQKDPFSYILVDRLAGGGTQVTWALRPTFGTATPWSFELQWGRPGSDSWDTVTTVTDTFTATDSTQRDYSSVLQGFYRVVLTDADGDSYPSRPSNFPSTWEARDLRNCDEIRRRERLAYDKVGMKCWVLFRKHWGTACSSCIDDTSEQVRNPRCTTCYGTGYEGGYFDPYPDKCRILGENTQVIPQLGTRVAHQMLIRMVPIPRVHEDDIIILEGSDLRLSVEKVSPEFVIKGRPIIEHFELKALEPTDIVYDITWSGSRDPSEGESSIWTGGN